MLGYKHTVNLKNKLKKNFLQLLIFSLFILISVILFQKFEKYLDQNNFAKISIIFILYFIFFLGSLTRKLSIISTIFLFYFILILYLTNSLFVYVEYNSSQKKNIEKLLKKKGQEFDDRTLLQVVNQERELGKEIYPYVVPREFLKNKNEEIIPLTPMPNKEYIVCNEFGKWKKIRTDQLGFNNKKYLKSFDILLMGDSFAEGSCVQKIYEPTNIFNSNTEKIAYNIGVSGNGPYFSLALAHELKDISNFKYIVWLIYDNDFIDIKLESKFKYLTQYTDKNFRNNNYFSHLEKVTEYQKKYINRNINNLKTGYSLKESIIELKALIHKINRVVEQTKLKESYNYSDDKFQKIFKKINYLYPNKKKYVVYLPESSCFKYRAEDCKKRFIHLNNASSKIIFLNFYDYIKNEIHDYKNMYALGQEGAHFSEYGYTKLVNFIDKEISLYD